HYTFRFILDYSGGQVTNFGAHHLDIAQWGNDTDNTGPVEIKGTGQFPKSGLFNTATNVNVEYSYANGVKLFLKTGTEGTIKFKGSDGWVSIKRGRIVTSPESLVESKIKPSEIHLYNSRNHAQNFLNCIKTRRDPITSVETGHRSATLCHLGNIAMLLGRTLKWDPAGEKFINDDQADRMRKGVS
ncbi:MAG: gfo/Idh/MocA family oxidoreductase, partial [Planctomycetota bacterium]